MSARRSPLRADTGAAHHSRLRTAQLLAGAIALALAALAAVTGHLDLTRARPATAPPAPWEYFDPAWADILGGDQALTDASYARLNTARTGLTPELAAAARKQAAATVLADLGAHPADGRYWPPAGPAPAQRRCATAGVLGSAPAALATTDPDHDYIKVLVALTGRCGTQHHTVAAPLVQYVYLRRDRAGLVPLRDWQVPAAADGTPSAVIPQDWELKRFSACAAPDAVRRARIVVVDAFEQMCAAAARDRVTLRVTQAFRTRAEQAALFARAVQLHGGEDRARAWVAYADAEVCTSRHCSGLAVNVAPGAAADAWLRQTVGCNGGGRVTAAATCPAGTTPVPRMATYGFAAPAAAIPSYLEFVLPVPATAGAGSLAEPSCNPAAVAVPNMVAAIFRCRLARAGVSGAEQDTVVAEALAVSRCESGWNATAAAFNGRFATAPNPADGRRYTQSGVFMISRDLADAGWVRGGPGALTDPVANINAAASLYLATGGWEQFGCATGAPTGFDTGPVLPRYGGPKLPAWAGAY